MKKIILVENKKKDLRLTVKALLEKHDYDVITSHSSQDCIEKINEGEKPDLILIDSTMPRKGLDEITKKLKNVKIVYLVMDSNEAAEVKLFKNVVGFVEEPRDIKAFVDKINAFLNE